MLNPVILYRSFDIDTNFYVVDVAQTESGDWLVVELNEGQMSGLSDNNPDIFYSALKQSINNKLRRSHNIV